MNRSLLWICMEFTYGEQLHDVCIFLPWVPLFLTEASDMAMGVYPAYNFT